MTELKAKGVDDVYLEYFNTGNHDLAKVYLKSEADKVIEELKHQRDGAFGLTNSGLTLDDISQMARKQLDHQKYKRCLAMAERWLFAFHVTNKCNDKFYLRSLKYRELAEKFKDGK